MAVSSSAFRCADDAEGRPIAADSGKNPSRRQEDEYMLRRLGVFTGMGLALVFLPAAAYALDGRVDGNPVPELQVTVDTIGPPSPPCWCSSCRRALPWSRAGLPVPRTWPTP